VIGDAAHVMSPVGGVGINYTIQDAVVTANAPAEPLKECQAQLKDLDIKHLAAVQHRRELPTRLIQRLQALIQQQILAPALCSNAHVASPGWLRLLPSLPILRSIPARIVAFGFWPVRVKDKYV